MVVLVPLKSVVLILGLFTGLVLGAFIGSSLLESTTSSASCASQRQHTVGKQMVFTTCGTA